MVRRGGEKHMDNDTNGGAAVASTGLLAELFADLQRIDETSILPDGDWVSVCVATWAAEWVKRLKDAGLITANSAMCVDGDAGKVEV